MMDAVESFRDAMRAAGLEPPAVIEPGRFLRFAGIDKRPGNRAGWCLLFADGRGGVFGDWASGFSESWQAECNQPYSRAERLAFARQVAAAKKEAEALRQKRLAKAARCAQVIWQQSAPVPANHPYLLRKCIPAMGARQYKGALVLPVRSFHSRLTSLQFIDGEGGKKLLSGGRKRGCFIPVFGDQEHPRRIIICEGWATGCTLAEDEPEAWVLAAIDAGNLKAVALGARCRWPDTRLVIAGDDDRLTPGNPGATKAKAAAQASGALLALPRWPADAPKHLTDFNDLANWLRGGPRQRAAQQGRQGEGSRPGRGPGPGSGGHRGIAAGDSQATADLDFRRHPGTVGRAAGRARGVHGLALLRGRRVRSAAGALFQRHPQPGSGTQGPQRRCRTGGPGQPPAGVSAQSTEVLACPWCRNRLHGKSIPRPVQVRCGDCRHFQRINHPHLGHCNKGQPEAVAGLWDETGRGCGQYLPVQHNGSNGPD